MSNDRLKWYTGVAFFEQLKVRKKKHFCSTENGMINDTCIIMYYDNYQ